VKEKSTGKLLAIKKVFQDPAYSNREFKIVQMLDHGCCVRVYSFFFTKDESSGKSFLNLVMDFVPHNLH
jgi:hypothetical protein